LDASTESLILSAIRDLRNQGKTVIVIAHRLSAAREADRILVLQDGAIAESGSHAELLARPGLYSTLYNLQFGQHP
jgi:ABC-type multidrug transport system fused ATPase/permease subunit